MKTVVLTILVITIVKMDILHIINTITLILLIVLHAQKDHIVLHLHLEQMDQL